MNGFYPEGKLYGESENKRCMSSLAALADAQVREMVLEAPVIMCDTEHNLIVDLGCIKGIIPRNEGAIGIENGSTRDIALISRVGRTVCFVVTAFRTDTNGKTQAILSRRKAQELCRDYMLSSLNCGDIIDAKITHLESFGAFCDVGCGNIALLPIDAISVSRISHPSDRFSVGDNIRVIIKNIDEKGRISLSHKELLGTWLENANRFKAGQTVSGVVRSVEEYGVFVELAPNLAGLAEPKNNVKVGQTASVYIKSIIPEKMKIKLIIIDSFFGDNDKAFDYYYNEDFIDKWQYSPDCSIKTVVSLF